MSFAAEDFIEAESNRAARTALAAPVAWVNARLVLWGEPGCGKSHLGHIWAAERQAPIIAASGLREPLVPATADVLIEDIDTLVSPVALFATLERAHEAGQTILMTSRIPPARLTLGLADLESRLRASLTIRIEFAEQALLEALLVRLASNRQLTMPASLRQYLLSRLPRRPAVLREAIARLDRYALALGTAPSRRMAERLLAELADPAEGAPHAAKPADSIEIHQTNMRSLL